MKLENNSFTRLTLALDIVRKITDGPYRGFHELGTIKHRIDLCDIMTMEDAPRDTLECDNPAVPCDDRNVCMKVLRLVKTTFAIDRCARISILKRIPVMGGLAGGSANAATTFEMLNSLWDLKLSQDQMIRLSRGIGMDVPYYFVGGTAFDSEAGECLEPIATALTFTFILALPDFGVSTAEAYGALDYAVIGKQTALTSALRKALISGDAGSILSLLHNDFEAPVFSRYARLAEIKKNLVHAGCLASVLTGSGSTVLGIAHDRAHAEAVIKRLDCRAIIASTLKAG